MTEEKKDNVVSINQNKIVLTNGEEVSGPPMQNWGN